MSLNAEHSMQVDVNNSGINNAFAVQGDHVGRKIKITFLSQGEVVDLSNCTATVKCSANGKTIAVNTCNIMDNVVTVELTKTMLAYSGKVKMQVSVTDGSGAIISSPIIYLIVGESISTTPVEDTPDFSILADLTGRIMAVLNDPAVGDTEVKDARGGYAVLGDRLKAADNATAEIINTLGKHSHTKDIYTAANWSLYNGITMTPHSDGGYVSFNGTANTNAQTFLLSLDKSIRLDANKATFALAKIRLRAVGANVTVSFRDDAFFNSTNVIATNAQTITGTWITDKLTDGEWRTIWVVTGGDKTISKLGIQPLPTTSDYKLQVSSVDCYYSGDSHEITDTISDLQSDILQNESNIEKLQTATEQQSKDITAVNTTANKNSSDISALGGRVATAEEDIAALKTDNTSNKSRLTTAEGKISTLEQKTTNNTTGLNALGQRVGVAETDITNLKTDNTSNKSRLTTAESNISALQTKANTNATNITANTNAIAAANQNIATNTANISDLQAFVGYTNDDILGLQVDYQNKTFTRLAGAVGKTAGADFDSFAMYGGRRRCNVANDGTITAYFGDENYTENGSNGQVMVYQPKFYYKVVPLKLDKNTDSGIGYHIRKANYYVSATPHTGFKLHPAFYDESGNAVDYILYSAYEGSLYSNGHIVSDDSETEATLNLSADYLCSYANTKPISGLYKPITRPNLETLAGNHGAGWHLETIKSVAANQLLMIIELGTMNTQTAKSENSTQSEQLVMGLGVVTITDNLPYSCSSLTGSTADLGNSTGMAESTKNKQGNTETTYTENGKVAVNYRGIENPWGNIWKHINGINIWGDRTMCGGQLYVADDFNFNERKRDGNYNAVGFTLPNKSGYINAIGYGGEAYDWLLIPSEIGGSSALPVGDYCYVTPKLGGYKTARLGGHWYSGAYAGGFCWISGDDVGVHDGESGGRLVYVPTARI